MKRILKVLMWIIILAIVLVGGFLGYLYFSQVDDRDPFSMIPEDAIFVMETNNLNDGWNAISESGIWKHLKQNSYFADINESASMMDSLMSNDKTMDMLLSDRQMLVSAHMISADNYDFIFVVNVQKAEKASFLFDFLDMMQDYSITRRDYKGFEIIEMLDVKTKETLSMTFADNLLVGSYTGSLVEKAIDGRDLKYWENTARFQSVRGETKEGLFRFYFNYKVLPSFLACYMSEKSETIDGLSQALAFSAFDADIDDERLSLKGATSIIDTVPSYLLSLSRVKPGKSLAAKVIPDNVAFYLSMCFDDFDEFSQNLREQYKSEDTTGYEDYQHNIERVEKWFKLSLQEDFFSWIGSEIAFVKLQPSANAQEDDVLVFINADDIDDAKTGLDHFTRQVKRRSPVKFEEVEYHGYVINYLHVKGFFKMFFGKLFGELEKPYFTYIDDFVVFSNSPALLMDVIDNYTVGKVLARKEAYQDFRGEFSELSNITLFIQMPKLYSHMYHYGAEDTRTGLKENKDMIASFVHVGFQLVSDGDVFETTFICDHDAKAALDETLENIESSAEELFWSEYDSLDFRIDMAGIDPALNDVLKLYYDDEKVMAEGNVLEGLPHGVWRTYYESGNLKSVLRYENGKISGTCIFYYDEDGESKKAEMNFEEEVMQGLYIEYYRNGQVKAKIEVEEGLHHGEAVFYYDSGNVKIEGEYDTGLKEGKWKFFSEAGEEIAKKKYSEGIEKE